MAPNLGKEDNYQRILKLIYDVRNANINKAMPPIVRIIDMDKFRPKPVPLPELKLQLPEICSDYDLAYSYSVDVSTYPMPIDTLSHKSFSSQDEVGFMLAKQSFIQSLNYSEYDISYIESINKDKQEDEWMAQRRACVTATKALRIMNFISKKRCSPDSLICEIMQYNYDKTLSSRVPALAWGVKNESKALNQYFLQEKNNHPSLQITRPGIIVSSSHPYIRCSPDAITNCNCHGKQIIEVKCPYKFRNQDVNQMIDMGKIDYIEKKENNEHVLKINNQRGYFQQIMQQMAITGIHTAKLLLWSKKGFLSISVNFDQKYWEQNMLPSLITFFCDFIVPEILTQKVAKLPKKGPQDLVFCDNDNNDGITDEVTQHDVCEDFYMVDGKHYILQTASDITFHHEQNMLDDHAYCLVSSVDDVAGGQASASNNEPGKNCTEKCTNSSNTKSCEEVIGQQWILGCKEFCKNDKASNYSKVKGELIACDANLLCEPNTWYHLYCEGFRKVPCNQTLEGLNYACRKCRQVHPDKENLITNSGFYK